MDVYDGNDELLKGKHDQLDALIDMIDRQPHGGIRSGAKKLLKGGGDLEKTKIDNYHDEKSTKDSLVAHDEM